MALRDGVKLGGIYVFNYPHEFTTLPDYDAVRGRQVCVVRRCTQKEADQGAGMERMFRVRVLGARRHYSAWASELAPAGQ